MNKKLASLLETKRLIPVSIVLQIIGVVFLSVGLFTIVPWIMILTMPAGMGALGLGMLGWAIFFFRDL